MTEAEAKARMEHHGITTAQQAVYYYKGFKYGNVKDAVTYAELITSREFAARRQTTKTNR